MIGNEEMRPVDVTTPVECPSPEYIASGIPTAKELRVTIFSPLQWESFTEEWISSLKSQYVLVRRYGGAGDKGVDVAGYCSDDGLEGEWHNYQCKHYGQPLAPSDIWVEIGKMVYYSFKNEYLPPRKYFFVTPRGIGTTLGQLLDSPNKLKARAKQEWEKYCTHKITKTATLPLEGELLEWFENFDFSIFSSVSVVELVEGHAQTPFHTVRFGGGLPHRALVDPPPEEHAEKESRYLTQLFNVYEEHLGTPIHGILDIIASSKPHLRKDLLKQRERFYSAEALRNFARDNVPKGTFTTLQEEIFDGVVDGCEDDHDDGFTRMKSTIRQATTISLTSNPLVSVTRVRDRQGICHQLANEDRLTWVPTVEKEQDDVTI